ncbi:MAG: SIR2 family protein [Actinomycetota bacterium]
MPEIDPLLSLAFAMHANRGTMAVLLGSGASGAAGIPTGWGVVLDLAAKLAEMQGDGPQDDVAGWYARKFGKQPDYSDLLDALVRTADERRGLLHSYFEPTDEEREQGRKQPTAAHRAIARLVKAGHIRVILTTNFDRLMETALREEGIEPVVISSPDGIKGAPPMAHWQCVVIKLHGDYLDPRIRNTEGELAAYAPETDQLLDRIFDEFGLIISGWSGEWDVALRSAMERCPTRRFSCLWGDRGALGPKARALATLRAIEVVEGLDADGLFVGLEDHLASLAEIAERRHPLTPAVAVATAKRWLADPERNRIRLHDLVMAEVERVCTACGPKHFPIQGVQPTAEEFLKRLKRYEAATETLCALAATFAQWGDDRHRTLWTKVIERLDGLAVSQSGYTIWNDLQRYPVLLLLYAGGIGAVEAGRYDWIKALLADPIRRQDEERKHPIGRRLDAAHELGKHFGSFPDVARGALTLGSDHIFAYLQSLFQTSQAYHGRFQQAFDRFEFMFVLWRMMTGSYPFYGCFAWRRDYDMTREIVEEASRAGDDWAPLKQGFITGTVADVRDKCKELAARIEKLGWR